jgi:hypothetical protein
MLSVTVSAARGISEMHGLLSFALPRWVRPVPAIAKRDGVPGTSIGASRCHSDISA